MDANKSILEDPLDMLIVCPRPKCGKQHIDRPDPLCGSASPLGNDHMCQRVKGHDGPCMNDPEGENARWTNPPHKSHTCRTEDGGCGQIFRIADYPTNGVEKIRTEGKDDTWHNPHGLEA